MSDGALASVYLLAAGRGSRAGAPKALADLDGLPLLERQLRFACHLVDPSDVFVSVQQAWLPEWAAKFPGVRFVAVDPDQPPLSSLIALLDDRPPVLPGFVYHVDMPLWEPRVYAALLKALKPGWDGAVPRYQGKRGHPVLLSKDALARAAFLKPAVDRLDVWLHSRKIEVVDVPFSCVVENWNFGVQR